MSAATRADRPDMFGCLCDIGEVVGIMRDIAARHITESKPIQGTAIDMLARLIEQHVQRAMDLPPPSSAAQVTLEPAPDSRDRSFRTEDLTDHLTRVRQDLSGLALLAVGLADLGRDSEIEAGAVGALGDLARKSRDDLTAALKEVEALK